MSKLSYAAAIFDHNFQAAGITQYEPIIFDIMRRDEEIKNGKCN